MTTVEKVFRCTLCDKDICDKTFPCSLGKGRAYVSGVLDCVQKTGQGKKLSLVCSCGENVGEFVAYKKELKYCLDMKKVKRCSVRRSANSCDAENVRLQRQSVPLPTDLVAPTISKKVGSPGNKLGNISTLHQEEAKKGNEIMQLKRSIAALEERIKCMETNSEEKLKDLCGMLLSQKLEIQRLQEIIWALHPSINLDSVFTVDDKASCFDMESDTSRAGLGVEED